MKNKNIIFLILILILASSSLFSCAPKAALQSTTVLEEQAILEETTSAPEETVKQNEDIQTTENTEASSEEPEAIVLGVSTVGYGVEYIILVDSKTGKLIRKVIDEKSNSYAPILSPDGSKILFYTDDDGDYDIYIINSDGTGLKNLTDNDNGDFLPKWSSDGSKICYSSDETGNTDVFIMNSDGTDKRGAIKNNKENYGAIFSPDGSKIFYVSNEEGDFDIYSIGLDGAGKTKLTNDEYFENDLVFSPDGSKILYSSGQIDSTVFEVSILDLNNSSVSQITETMSYGRLPLWVENGGRIIFNSDMEGYAEIYIMNTDGSEMKNLTNNDVDDKIIYVSTDGFKIYYQSFYGDEKTEVMMYDLETSKTIKILENEAAG